MERPVFELLEECLVQVNSAKRMARQLRRGPAARIGPSSGPREEVEPAGNQRRLANEQRPGEAPRTGEAQEQREGTAKARAPGPGLGGEGGAGVEAVLRAFATQVARWRGGPRTDPGPAQFAAYLSDHFLCEQLDPLPRSKMVSVARKAVALEIEKIARLEPGNGAARALPPAQQQQQQQQQQQRQRLRAQMVRNGKRRMQQLKPSPLAQQQGQDGGEEREERGKDGADEVVGVGADNGNAPASGSSTFDSLVARLETLQQEFPVRE